MTEPAQCYCGSKSWERWAADGNRFICCSCKRPLWQPIETAPLMEPIIVTWKNDKGDPVVWMVCKNIISTHADTEHWETFNLDKIVSYWSSDMDGEDQLEVRPTHWMPLPAPPKNGDEK